MKHVFTSWQGSVNGAVRHICIKKKRPLGQIANKGYKKLTSKNYDPRKSPQENL